MDTNIELLNFIYQNSEMGKHTIEELMHDVGNEELLNHLKVQLDEYKDIHYEAQNMLHSRGQEEKDLSQLEKLSSSFSISMKAMVDNSPTHIAEIMIQRSTMGIIDITKNINNYEDADKEILKLGKKLLKTEESNVKYLKGFL